MEDWTTWIEHWRLLVPVLLAPLGWLGRRRAVRPWRALVRQTRLLAELESCKQDLESCQGSRRNEQSATQYAMVALREITSAATLVRDAADQGRLTTSEPLPTAPLNSRSRSTGSRRTRKSPLDLP
jgi:hypothetical protein